MTYKKLMLKILILTRFIIVLYVFLMITITFKLANLLMFDPSFTILYMYIYISYFFLYGLHMSGHIFFINENNEHFC